MRPATLESSKVPEVTIGFWLIKIAATTLGETGGDAVSMTMNLGYAISTGIFAVLFLVAVTAQIHARSFRPLLYWAVIIATTTVGTTMADFADRSIGFGYVGGTLILAVLLAAALMLWWATCETISVDAIQSPGVETFYWITILFSNTLGTALGDFLADDGGLGYGGGALVFGTMLAVIAGGYYLTSLSRTALFWTAFILTRPLGATVGDFLDKPRADGGLELSRVTASAVLLIVIIVCIYMLPQRAGRHPGHSADLA
jgi:uncharacterized membrane-anchored protein